MQATGKGLSWGLWFRQGRPLSVPLGLLDSGWAAAGICHHGHHRAGCSLSVRTKPQLSDSRADVIATPLHLSMAFPPASWNSNI